MVLIGVTLAPSICSSVVNVVAIVLSYLIDRALNDPRYVFPGLACSLAAIVLGALTQYVHERTTGEVNFVDERFRGEPGQQGGGGGGGGDEAAAAAAAGIKAAGWEAAGAGAAARGGDEERPGAGPTGSAGGDDASRRRVLAGVGLAVGSGVVTGLFLPAVSIACNDPFQLLRPQQRPLSVYAASLWLTLATGLATIAVNLVLLYRWGHG